MKIPDFRNNIWIVVWLGVSLFFIISLISYEPNDLTFYTSHQNLQTANWAGIIGAWISGTCFFSLGLSAYSIPILVLLIALDRSSIDMP